MNQKRLKVRMLGFVLALIICFSSVSLFPSDVQAAGKEYIRITKSSKTLYMNSDSYKIPIKKKNVKKIKWKSSNKGVVSVTKNGKITAVKPGKAKITVTARGKKSKKLYKSTIIVTVPQISLKYKDISFNLVKGNTTTKILNVSGLAADAMINWESDNPSVVSIQGSGKNNKSGYFTALDYGTAHITASYGDKSVEFTVVVLQPSIRYNNLNKSIKVGKSQTYIVNVNYAPETDLIEWTSSDPNICSVQGSGKSNNHLTVTGISQGTVTVTGVIPGSQASITFNIVVQ